MVSGIGSLADNTKAIVWNGEDYSRNARKLEAMRLSREQASQLSSFPAI